MTPGPQEPSAEQLLREDEHSESRVFWKGLLALALTVAIAWARQRWWL